MRLTPHVWMSVNTMRRQQGAFAAATAIAHDAELWTGDPELLVSDAPWRWRDLRRT